MLIAVIKVEGDKLNKQNYYRKKRNSFMENDYRVPVLEATTVDLEVFCLYCHIQKEVYFVVAQRNVLPRVSPLLC